MLICKICGNDSFSIEGEFIECQECRTKYPLDTIHNLKTPREYMHFGNTQNSILETEIGRAKAKEQTGDFFKAKKIWDGIRDKFPYDPRSYTVVADSRIANGESYKDRYISRDAINSEVHKTTDIFKQFMLRFDINRYSSEYHQLEKRIKQLNSYIEWFELFDKYFPITLLEAITDCPGTVLNAYWDYCHNYIGQHKKIKCGIDIHNGKIIIHAPRLNNDSIVFKTTKDAYGHKLKVVEFNYEEFTIRNWQTLIKTPNDAEVLIQEYCASHNRCANCGYDRFSLFGATKCQSCGYKKN